MYSLSNGMYSWPLHVQPEQRYVQLLPTIQWVAATYAQYIGTGMSQLAKGPGMSTPYLI